MLVMLLHKVHFPAINRNLGMLLEVFTNMIKYTNKTFYCYNKPALIMHFKSFFALHKCELIKKMFVVSSHNLSQNLSKYASDIDYAVTFSSKQAGGGVIKVNQNGDRS